MTTKEFSKGQVIFESGQKMDALYMIIKGAVSASHLSGQYLLRSGDVVGLCGLDSEEARMKYVAEDNVSVIVYPYRNEQLLRLFEVNQDAIRFFRVSAFRQLNEMVAQYKRLKTECTELYDYTVGSYEVYMKFCEAYHISPGQPEDYERFGKLSLEKDMPVWFTGYYSTLEQMLAVWDSNKTDNAFIYGFLLRASQDLQHLIMLCGEMQEYKKDAGNILMNENTLDLLELLTFLYCKIAPANGMEDEKVISVLKKIGDMMARLKKYGLGEAELYTARKAAIEKKIQEMQKKCAQPGGDVQEDEAAGQEISGSLEKILSYAECDENLAASFRENIEKYKKVANKNGSEDDIRTLRQRITKEFYQIYEDAFIKSLKGGEIPTVVKMLFNFGYVDEEVAGISNAVYLYEIIDNLPTSPEDGVYSYYEWLMAVYEGKKEPSRNEFDLDYIGYLHEEKRMGRISQAEESNLINDNVGKVRYEIQNVFPGVNKMSFGRISTFCPIFSEHNVMKDLESALVSKDKVAEIINSIREKDFGAYYRETLFTKPEQGVSKEFINIEILPDVILTPNMGTRGVMWQEIEGKRRNTPGRMLSSIFQIEDLNLILIRLTGEFRWEMCKRMQGARWNDVSERSLTSEYFDYIQFFRKNQELSTDAKERIKSDMGRAKNSFKEMFIMDYITWMLYESNGAPRLNKVARTILFTYCPFTKAIREKLKANPMYREIAERYEMRMGQKRHRMDNLCQKLTVSGKGIPEEIEREKEFLYM